MKLFLMAFGFLITAAVSAQEIEPKGSFAISGSKTAIAMDDVWKGKPCNVNRHGDIGMSEDGLILSCQYSRWVLVESGADSGMYAYFDSATCPPGWMAANGSNGTRDMRGRFIRGVGGDSAARGVAQGDAIRNISASFDIVNRGSDGNYQTIASPSGAFRYSFTGGSGETNNLYLDQGGRRSVRSRVSFDASRVVPTANENRPVNIALMACKKS